uniref:Uncharacterized protein n=1 Tax=Kalanchoe fedtschenkoi TaxID=63787 RepID=A0A7N0TT94_KALFE
MSISNPLPPPSPFLSTNPLPSRLARFASFIAIFFFSINHHLSSFTTFLNSPHRLLYTRSR